jgi:hypothetical protein
MWDRPLDLLSDQNLRRDSVSLPEPVYGADPFHLTKCSVVVNPIGEFECDCLVIIRLALAGPCHNNQHILMFARPASEVKPRPTLRWTGRIKLHSPSVVITDEC